VEAIKHVRDGWDTIFVAGTGAGKSLVFQGLAAICPKNKFFIVISPLKALERDQVCSDIYFCSHLLTWLKVMEAERVGVKAAMVNEDTKCPELWKDLRAGQHSLYYVSPEMALCNAFLSLWQGSKFKERVQGVIVDEAHCIAEWGNEFRPEYQGLAKLRNYVGQGPSAD